MNALTFSGIKELTYTAVTDPTILTPSDVIVKVHQAGICGSDLHIYHGRESGLDHGTVMGHEFVGEVVEIGRDVKSLSIGNRVCSPFTINCGACFYCHRGLTARCPEGKAFFGWVENGVGLQGAQAEFVRVPLADSTLVKIPHSLTSEEALLLGDNFSTGFFCADMAEVNAEGTYVVLGCGVVGMMCILAARSRGARRIIAVDNVPYRLSLAAEFGATDTTTAAAAALAIVQDATDGRGADAVLEAVGLPSAQELAFRLVRPGGILAVVGLHTAPTFAFSPFDAYNHNLTYKTGRCSARYYMEQLLPTITAHRQSLQRIISHRLPLKDGVDGYRLFDTKAEECMKVVLNID